MINIVINDVKWYVLQEMIAGKRKKPLKEFINL